MEKKQLVVLYQSDFAGVKSGFGRHTKSLFTFLDSLGKYKLINLACGINYSNNSLKCTPWLTVGCLPDDENEINRINQDQGLAKSAAYGGYYIDRIILEQKPDVWIGAQDIWAFTDYYKKPWFNKIATAMSISIDSVPILNEAIEQAKHCKNYFVWSKFAERELHRLGQTHVATIPGCVDDKDFCRLPDPKRAELRNRFGIKPETFIFGFVFRNQIRKLVPNLLDGFKLFKQENPNFPCKLLLHTCFSEGWQIPQLLKERGLSNDDVLTTYTCHACAGYTVAPFVGEGQNCKICGAQKSQHTTNVARGVSEKELNEIYNLMDAYVHPATSGALEIPLIEAQLTELPVMTSPYSFGEDICESPAALPLDFNFYYEIGTQFKKSSTCPKSICKQMMKVTGFTSTERASMGKAGRQWALDNYSVAVIGKKWETFLDSIQPTTYDFDFKEKPKNPVAPVPDESSDTLWIMSLYKLILNMTVDASDQGLNHWLEQIKRGMPRNEIENYFRSVAEKENRDKHNTVSLSSLLENTGRKRFLIVCKESIGDLLYVNCLLESFKKSYPDYDIYLACEPAYFEIFDGNPNIIKCLPWCQEMESEVQVTGMGSHTGYFDGYCYVPALTQRFLNYLTNNRLAISTT